jgi:hypothetical protein
MGCMKQQAGADPEAIRTLELLSESHRKKAKILKTRIMYAG